MPSDILLDSTLLVRVTLEDTRPLSLAFQNDPTRKAQFIQSLLLYDRVGIPTYDFGIVPVLTRWLGHGRLLDLVRSGSICFVHRQGLLGYGGGGQGLCVFKIIPGGGRRLHWSSEALFGSTEQSVELQVVKALDYLPRAEQSSLIESVLQQTSIQKLEEGMFDKHVAGETYEDIASSPAHQGYLDQYYGRSGIVATALPDLADNQMRVLTGGGPNKDPTDLALRIADTNLDLLHTSLLGGADLYAPAGGQDLLKAKLGRARVAPATIEGFSRVLRLSRLPDLGSAVAASQVSLQQALDLRQRQASHDFRQWLRQVPVLDADDLVAAYMAALVAAGAPQSLGTRTLRLVLTTAAGIVNPIVGLGGSAIDTYFVDRWLAGYNPRVFIDEIASLNAES